jgi:hypothetical protein
MMVSVNLESEIWESGIGSGRRLPDPIADSQIPDFRFS